MLKERLPIYALPYGTSTVPFSLPHGLSEDWIQYDSNTAADDPKRLINEALAAPIGSPALSELAVNRSKAVILISDRTRLCPSYLFLPELIEQLNSGGLADENITIIVALGMHRKHTEAELKELVGETVFGRVAVFNHSALSEDCIYVGVTSSGTPVEINRHVVEADLRIATGNIRPHRLVGASGGVKALVPGVASHACIEHNHALSQKIKVNPGESGNAVHDDLVEAAAFVPIHFLFNLIVNHRRELFGAVAGHIGEAHRKGIAFANDLFLPEIDTLYDVVIASAGGFPDDTQLYQIIKTLQNAASIAKPGGSIVLAARCEEMYGNGLFQYWVETIGDRALMVRMLQERFVLGPHKIEHIDEILKKNDVYLYSELPPSVVDLVGFRPVKDLSETIRILTGRDGQRVAIMPYGALTFPRLKGHM